MSKNEAVSIRVLDRDYTIGVAADEQDILMAASRVLDQRMREIRGNNRTATIDRIAVLAALNMAHDMQLLRNQLTRREEQLQQLMNAINRRLDQALDVPDAG